MENVQGGQGCGEQDGGRAIVTDSDNRKGSAGETPPLTDAELTELALSTEPGLPPPDDALPISSYLGQTAGLLPAWYMPTPMSRVRPRWQLAVVIVLVAAFVIIEAFGLCSTFGQVVPA